MRKYQILMIALLIGSGWGAYAKVIKRKIPDKLVVMTFDDAVASQYNNVMPLLEKYKFGSSFYICEFPPNFADTAKYMSWEKIGKLGKMGYDIGNHTRTHILLNKASREQIVEELEYIDNKCLEVGLPKPTTFAYPGYGIDSCSVDLLASMGYKFARLGDDRLYDPLTDHPLRVPSFSVTMDNREALFDYINQAKDGKIAVLTFHGVPDEEHPWVTLSLERFRELVEYLHNNGFKVISMKDLNKYTVPSGTRK